MALIPRPHFRCNYCGYENEKLVIHVAIRENIKKLKCKHCGEINPVAWQKEKIRDYRSV